jgi:hypothetical protein
MNETTLSDVLTWTWRVWVGTWKIQLMIGGTYAALLALGAGSLMSGPGPLSIIGLLLLIALVPTIPALPFIIAGMIAPDAGAVLRGQPAPFEVPWRRVPSIVVWSIGLTFVCSMLSYLFVFPAYFALSALWPWTMVLACEPQASAVARAQELSDGFRLRFCWWHICATAITGVPALIFLSALTFATITPSGQEVAGGLFSNLLLTLAPLVFFLVFGSQASFLAALYQMIRRERDMTNVEDLLNVFE